MKGSKGLVSVLRESSENEAHFGHGWRGSQCHPPPQGGTGCSEMDDISLPHGWSCTEQEGPNNKKV